MRVSKFDIDLFLNPDLDEQHYDIQERQQLALDYLEKEGRITNWEYVNLCQVGYRTAHRDLTNLIDKGVVQIYKMGRSTYYALTN